MQLLPVSRATAPVYLLLLSDRHLHLLQGRKGHKQMRGNMCTKWALLCLSYTEWTALGCGAFVSLCGLAEVRERNAWKTMLRFLFIEYFTPGAGVALGSVVRPAGSTVGCPGAV